MFSLSLRRALLVAVFMVFAAGTGTTQICCNPPCPPNCGGGHKVVPHVPSKGRLILWVLSAMLLR